MPVQCTMYSAVQTSDSSSNVRQMLKITLIITINDSSRLYLNYNFPRASCNDVIEEPFWFPKEPFSEQFW